jgi:hypothetical protein
MAMQIMIVNVLENDLFSIFIMFEEWKMEKREIDWTHRQLSKSCVGGEQWCEGWMDGQRDVSEARMKLGQFDHRFFEVLTHSDCEIFWYRFTLMIKSERMPLKWSKTSKKWLRTRWESFLASFVPQMTVNHEFRHRKKAKCV